MKHRVSVLAAACAALFIQAAAFSLDLACCGAPPPGHTVLNADQTVIILWDPLTKIEHFIRRASFKSDAADFGFLIPTPSQPELDESGNDAFPFLQKLTEPEVVTKRAFRFANFGCGSDDMKKPATTAAPAEYVNVLESKRVAGFDAVVLEASSAKALVDWLLSKGYFMSPEIQAWVKPYVDLGWKITALKVAGEGGIVGTVDASALRMSFKTDRPLFPYREPDYNKSKDKAGLCQYQLTCCEFILSATQSIWAR